VQANDLIDKHHGTFQRTIGSQGKVWSYLDRDGVNESSTRNDDFPAILLTL
jgi:hypothetical protein